MQSYVHITYKKYNVKGWWVGFSNIITGVTTMSRWSGVEGSTDGCRGAWLQLHFYTRKRRQPFTTENGNGIRRLSCLHKRNNAQALLWIMLNTLLTV